MPSVRWTGYDDIAHVYASVAEPLFFAAPARDLASLLDALPGGRALDIGTGCGAVALAVRDATSARVVGIDASVSMLRAARDRAADIQFAAAMLPELPARDGTFDAASIGFVLSHITDVVGALREIRRLLKRDGQIALSAWSVGPAETAPGRAWQQVTQDFVSAEELQQEKNRYLPSEEHLSSRERAIDVLRQAGFRECRAEQRSYRIAATMDEYIETRLVSMPSRYLYFNLSRSDWLRFVDRARETLNTRFGESVSFESSVNFAVARC